MAPRVRARRRRRTAEEAEREILDSAQSFLREHSFRDLRVDDVMDGTGLSRSSFYLHFRDRYDLAIRLIGEVATLVYAQTDSWLAGEGNPREALRSALRGTADVYVEQGWVLRAIADAASEDAAAEQAYVKIVEAFIDAVAKRIADDTATGRSQVADPRRTAAALVWMNERYLRQALGREPADDPARVAETLLEVWTGTLYSR